MTSQTNPTLNELVKELHEAAMHVCADKPDDVKEVALNRLANALDR